MDNVITFPNAVPVLWTIEEEATTPHISTKDIFERAAEKDFDDVMIIGRQSSGMFYFASSSGNLAELNWDLDKAKFILQSMMTTGGEDYEEE